MLASTPKQLVQVMAMAAAAAAAAPTNWSVNCSHALSNDATLLESGVKRFGCCANSDKGTSKDSKGYELPIRSARAAACVQQTGFVSPGHPTGSDLHSTKYNIDLQIHGVLQLKRET